MSKDHLDNLYNENIKDEDNKLLFEQYKIYVFDAQKTSDRRSLMNNFHLTAVILLFGAISFLVENNANLSLILLDLIGIVISFGWGLQLNYYNKLNSAKFKVINKIEQKFPSNGFQIEWDIFKSNKRTQFVASILELFLPVVIGIAFLIFLGYHIFT